MPTNNTTITPDVTDAFFLIPHIILTVWGLVVLLADLAVARGRDPVARRMFVGRLSMVGAGLALLGSVFVCLVIPYQDYLGWLFSDATFDKFANQDRPLFFGTLAGDTQVNYFNVLYCALLLLV